MEKIAWNRVLLIAILIAVIVAAVFIYNAVTAQGACDQWPAGSFDRQYCLETQ